MFQLDSSWQEAIYFLPVEQHKTTQIFVISLEKIFKHYIFIHYKWEMFKYYIDFTCVFTAGNCNELYNLIY